MNPTDNLKRKRGRPKKLSIIETGMACLSQESLKRDFNSFSSSDESDIPIMKKTKILDSPPLLDSSMGNGRDKKVHNLQPEKLNIQKVKE